MLQLDDLAQVAEDLRRQGIDACHQFLYVAYAALEGLEVGDEFYPLWELILPENQEAVERFDFAAIKARRGPEWSLARGSCPAHASGVGG
jgi:hypothetical protein